MNSQSNAKLNKTTEPAEQSKSRWQVLLRPRYAVPLIVITLLVALPISYRRSQIARLPDIGDPFDVEAFLNDTVPEERNAFVEYRQAEKLWVRFDVTSDEKFDPKNWNWKTASPEIEKWLEDNRKALEVWYRGTEKPEGQYIHPKDMAYNVLLPVTQAFHELNHLAILQSTKLQTEQKYAEAWDWLHAALRCSRHSGNNGCLRERYVGQKHFERTIPFIIEFSRNENVDRKLLNRMLKDVENNFANTANLVEILKLEYLANLCVFENGDFERFLEEGPVFLDGRFERWWWKTGEWLEGVPELSLRFFKFVYQNRLEYLAKPRNDRPDIKGNFDTFCDSSGRVLGTNLTWQELDEIAKSVYAKEFISGFMQYEEAGIREQALQHCLEIVIAAQIYRRQHGTFPEKLVDLKAILGDIPIDPWATKPDQPLHYRKENDGFVVWSVGENSIDDGGDVGADEEKEYGDIGFRVK